MSNYFPLHGHSTFSLLDGLGNPASIARRLVKTGLPGYALSDHGSVSGIPSFLRGMKEACKHCGYPKTSHAEGGKGRCLIRGETCGGFEPAILKALSACEFNVVEPTVDGCTMVKNGRVLPGDPTLKGGANRAYNHMVCIAKNREGWKGMLEAASASNDPAHYYYKPRLNIEALGGFAKGLWVTFSGHPGSALANACFTNYKLAYRAKTVEEARGFLKERSSLREDLTALAVYYRDLFGPENFFIEVQLFDSMNMPAALVVGECMRRLSEITGIPALATPDAHYAFPEDAADQRVLLCGSLKTTLREVQSQVEAGEDVTLGGFFRSNKYCIPSPEEMGALHTPEELANTFHVSEMCEALNLSSPPRMPKFPCPDGLDPDAYLTQLCESGWNQNVRDTVDPSRHDEYRARLNLELNVFREAKLSTYFLVVWDMVKYATEQLRCPVNEGRGSAGGCLTSYLLGITDSDPVAAKLYFERFYNTGRNAPGKVQYPDIDCDFPVLKRDAVYTYLQNRWGKDRVAHISTFSSLQGREALTQVLKAHSWGSHDERKEITERIPPKDAVSDKLQEMAEEEGFASLITWAVRHHPEDFAEWASLTPEGEWEGPLAAHFAQAARLEGCRRSQGTHPSGVIIAPEPLVGLCPMLYDKGTGETNAGMEFGDLEGMMGLVKLDVLGTLIQDRVAGAFDSIESGELTDEL